MAVVSVLVGSARGTADAQPASHTAAKAHTHFPCKWSIMFFHPANAGFRIRRIAQG
jgi:hypothetical protein